MALARGARFGPYEIADSIGAGGMGEVYRAVDTDLKREVAIKVLPPSFLSDGDRLARFQREAEVADWFAYEADASGQFEVVESFPEPTTAWPVSTVGGTQPRWSADGSELYFVSPELSMMAAPIGMAPGDDRTPEIGAPTALFPVRPAGDSLAEIVKAQYAVARDGRFLMHESAEESAAVPIALILNWAGARETGPLN